MTCGACGNTYPVSDLGINSWGGCQPVSIPPEYRSDNENEIVFSNRLLTFAEEMFSEWDNLEFDLSMENYKH